MADQPSRWIVEAEDRFGMTRDIVNVLTTLGANILAMEVTPGRVGMKITGCRDEERLKTSVSQIPGVQAVERVELLDGERREEKMEAVLSSVSEGIIAIDEHGLITTFNPAAEKILQITREQALGSPVGEVLTPEVPMLKTLVDGQGYDNKEIMIRRPQGTSHYITTGRPIKDAKGRTVGAVAAMKAMSDVMELVYSITKPAMITFADIIGESPALRNVVNLAKTVARTPSTVLIRGESGTGKELFARAIHMESPRRNRPFIPVNCAALPDTLLESELFGYEEGAFTGAQKGGKRGLFELARHGTIFLDEIGELSPHLQVKLLRVLQEGKVRRIGGREEVPVDVRVITATNRNLEAMVKSGEFREDLYYRLNVIPLYLPPLRERKEDIPVLAHSFVRKLNQKMGLSIKGFTPEALQKLQEHDWPGNVRELGNVVERAMTLARGEFLHPGDLLLNPREMGYSTSQPAFMGAENTPFPTLEERVAAVEREALKEALARFKSSRLAGKALGVSHTTILNKMAKYRLKE